MSTADQLEHPASNGVGEELERDVGNAEQRAGGCPEAQALPRPQDGVSRDHGEPGGEDKGCAFDDNQRGQRVARSVVTPRPHGERDDRKPDCRDDHADPLAASEGEAEKALGKHGEEDEPGREHGLDDRQRRPREGADMKPPGGDRHHPAQSEPPGAKEGSRASQRVPHPHHWRQDRAALLEQEGDVRRERGADGEDKGEGHAGSLCPEPRDPSHAPHGHPASRRGRAGRDRRPGRGPRTRRRASGGAPTASPGRAARGRWARRSRSPAPGVVVSSFVAAPGAGFFA